MKKNLFKYGVLIVLGYLFIKPIIPIGDYCSGLISAFNFIFFGGLLSIALLILIIINIIGIKKKNIRFDFIPLLIVFVFGVICFSISELDNRKFWTKKMMRGSIEVESTSRSGILELYENGSFAATLHSADYSCTFQGDYELVKGELKLKRADLAELTEKVFTTKYIVNKNNNTINPIDKNFGIIEILE